MPARIRIVFGLCAAAFSVTALAQGFAALVSPPRFEVSAAPGETVHQVFQLSNRAAKSAEYLIRTADWALDSDFGVTFMDALQPASCRPWVSLERPEAVLQGGATLHYRFEVAVPRDTPPGECRFAHPGQLATAAVLENQGRRNLVAIQGLD